MSSAPTLPLPVSDIIMVTVSVAAGAIPARPFDQGLIIGPSTVIPSYGSNPRLRQYPSLLAMTSDGFTTSEPEYLAAELYFSQNPQPLVVWVGRQDLTAIQTAIPHSGSAGTGYAVGDIITVVQSGASHGQLRVLTITTGGVVATLGTVLGNQGTAYSVASGLSTTGGTGAGLEVDITVIGEAYLQSVQTCQLFNQNWYGFMCCNATNTDHTALAAYSSANWQSLLYFGTVSDTTIPAGTAGNIALAIQAVKDKAFLIYSTTQGGTYPNNLYSAAGVIGLYCGLDTGLAGSAFTLNLKQLEGVAPEPLTQAQWNAIIAAGCNVCTTFGPYTGYISNGQLSSGDWLDSVLFRATLVNLIQTNLMNLLVSVPKIPQTEPGEHQLLAQVDDSCATMLLIGYLGPGVWTGLPVLTGLNTGQSLPLGYLNQAPPYSQQSAGDRAARKAMPIYSSILESGAVHSVQIIVNVEL